MKPDSTEIRRLMADINQAWQTGRVGDLAGLFHEDMMIVGPGYQVMGRGRDACVSSYREFVAATKIHRYEESGLEATAWETTAVCTYAWEMTYEQDGQLKTGRGTDQFVFTCAAGRWLAVWRQICFQPA